MLNVFNEVGQIATSYAVGDGGCCLIIRVAVEPVEYFCWWDAHSIDGGSWIVSHNITIGNAGWVGWNTVIPDSVGVGAWGHIGVGEAVECTSRNHCPILPLRTFLDTPASDKKVHSGLQAQRDGVREVKVFVIGGSASATNIVADVCAPKDECWVSQGVSIIAAVHHAHDVGQEQDAANYIAAFSFLDWAIL